jgi:hypothetical protein
MENTVDVSSFPYVASFYHSQINKTLGSVRANDMVRIYYNDNGDHATLGNIGGNNSRLLIGFGGMYYRAILDLVAWVERGVTPPPSTRFSIDANTQVVLPPEAAGRQGLQPVVTLTANGAGTVVNVAAGQPVTFAGKIQMPPGRGKVLQFDWYFGSSPVAYEAPTVLASPQAMVNVTRTVTFSTPGTYMVTLRTAAQRDGAQPTDAKHQNLARIRVVVQ